MASLISIPLLLAGAYLLGAIPFALILVRLFSSVDVREVGSGNIGATNARRAAGTPVAVAVLICDLLKGMLPVLAARWWLMDYPHGPWYAAAAAMAAVLGHMFPIYLKFKPSGKGVATTLGAFLVLAPLATATALAVFLLMTAITRRVSVGSLAGAVSLVPAAWLTTHEPAATMAGVVVAALIVIRHKENIDRLRQGREPTLDRR
jgi:glycerol-3-phosphate acyltransferase PlsY